MLATSFVTAAAATNDTPFVLLRPVPGLDLMQYAQTVVLLAAAIYMLLHLMSLAAGFFGSAKHSTGSPNASSHRRGHLLIGPMFVDGEVRWIHWSGREEDFR